MNFTAWVDVAIGLSVVYLGASLLVTIINEFVAQIFNLRGWNLRRNLQKLVDDDDLRQHLKTFPQLARFFPRPEPKSEPKSKSDQSEPAADGEHPKGFLWIARFFDTWRAPSYVDPLVLARLLLSKAPDADIEKTIEALPDSRIKVQLATIASTTNGEGEKLVQAVSEWADRSLTMLGEGYKKQVQWISFGIGLVIACLCNLDTLALTDRLYHDKEARDAAVAIGIRITETTDKAEFDRCIALPAQEREKDPKCAELSGLVEAVRSRNATLGKLPVGWAGQPFEITGLRFLGWLLTAFALSLGAPFWFDLLNRFVSVRHGMKKPDAAPAEK